MTHKNLMFCVLFGFLQRSVVAIDYETCKTPKNETSLCVELTECGSLDTLAQKGVQTREETIFLANSQCAYKDNTVYVCCPPNETKGIGLGTGLLPRAPECGITLNVKIRNGNLTVAGEFPWNALIEYTKPRNEKGLHCGGALINSRYVVTAAHCLLSMPARWRVTGVRLGEWDLKTNPECVAGGTPDSPKCASYVEVNVEDQIPHPLYNPRLRTQENDIALLRLSQSIRMTDNIKPICLPIDASLRDASLDDREMIVSGWGNTFRFNLSSVKLKTPVKVLNLGRCKASYVSQRMALQSTQMCARGTMSGVNGCPSDSGGPLVGAVTVNDKLIYYLMGIESFGPTPCTLINWPSVYTRVADYVDWITSTIRP